MENKERVLGSMLGLAVGDALGTALEFKTPGTFTPVTDMLGGGAFHLLPGEWTDDTSMALCLAESLVECGFDPLDQMKRYLRWYRAGYMSSREFCFDIGNTVRAALERFEQTGKPNSGETASHTAGNGSIMRLAPVPLYYADRPEDAVYYSGESSKTTHGAATAVDACRYLGGLIAGAVAGVSKEELLSAGYAPVRGLWEKHPLGAEINAVAAGSFKVKQPPAIKGSGHVVKSLEAALWAFYNSDTFRDGALLAVNLGDDADTTGAVYGQLAGAFYGVSGIPEEWLAKLMLREFIGELSLRLLCRWL